MSCTATTKAGVAPQTVFDVAKLAAFNDDSIVSRTLLNTNSGSLTFFAFATGQRLSEHTCPYDAFAIVVEGAARITIGGTSFDVNAGQMILMPANVPHAVEARQSFKMMLTMFKANSGQ